MKSCNATHGLSKHFNILLVPINKKYCFKCKQTKEKSEFHKDKNRKNGLQPVCVICAHERAKKYWLIRKYRDEQQEKKSGKNDSTLGII